MVEKDPVVMKGGYSTLARPPKYPHMVFNNIISYITTVVYFLYNNKLCQNDNSSMWQSRMAIAFFMGSN